MILIRFLLRWITLFIIAVGIAIATAKAIGAVLPDDGLYHSFIKERILQPIHEFRSLEHGVFAQMW